MIDESWTLFLDRDGVINKELPGDYVRRWDEFNFESGALEAIRILSGIFSRIYIVTNQRGIGIGAMKEDDLFHIHKNMVAEINAEGGRIDGIYYCPDADRNSPLRKPRPGMAFKAKEEHPEIDFSKSVIAGNSGSDMDFGRNLGMTTVFIDDKKSRNGNKNESMDYIFNDLLAYARFLENEAKRFSTAV